MDPSGSPPTKVKRTSILKSNRPAPPRSPLQCLEANQDALDEDRTTVTRTTFKRRVSFSRTNKVQEFCLEAPQTWGQTYEKELSPEPQKYHNREQTVPVPFQTMDSLQDLLSSEIKSGPHLVGSSYSCSTTSEVLQMCYSQGPHTMNMPTSSSFVTSMSSSATITSESQADASDDDMDITAPAAVPPVFVPLAQLPTPIEVDKENLLKAFNPVSDIQKSTNTSSLIMDTTLGNFNRKSFNIETFPNVNVDSDDYEPSPVKTAFSDNMLDQTRIEDSAMEMSTCSMADDSNIATDMNKTLGKSDKSMKLINKTMNESFNMDITEYINKTASSKNQNMSIFAPNTASSSSTLDMTGAETRQSETGKMSNKTMQSVKLNQSTPMLITDMSVVNTTRTEPPHDLYSSANKSVASGGCTTSIMMESMKDTSAVSMNKTLAMNEKSSMDVTKATSTKSSLHDLDFNKSMMEQTRMVSPDLQNPDCNKSMMDITRTTSPGDILQKSMMDITRTISPGDSLQKSIVDTTRTISPGDNLHKSVSEKSIMDITRTVSPGDSLQTSVMDITRTVSPGDSLQKSMMDITRTVSPGDNLHKSVSEKSMMDITHTTSPGENENISANEKSSMNVSTMITPGGELQKSLMDITRTVNSELGMKSSDHEKSVMDITRMTSPDSMMNTSNINDILCSKNEQPNMETTLEELNMHNKGEISTILASSSINDDSITNEILDESRMLLEDVLPVQPVLSENLSLDITLNNSLNMDMTEVGDVQEDKREKTSSNIENSETTSTSPQRITITETKTTRISSPTFDKLINLEKSTVIDKISHETNSIESCKIVETHKISSPSKECELHVSKIHITEDREDLKIDDTTGELSRKVKHIEIEETIESEIPIIIEPESQGTKVELGSTQELYLSPVVSNKSSDVATLITRSNTSPNKSQHVAQKLSFSESSNSPTIASQSGELKRSSECLEDEDINRKKICHNQTEGQVQANEIPTICVTSPTDSFRSSLMSVETERSPTCASQTSEATSTPQSVVSVIAVDDMEVINDDIEMRDEVQSFSEVPGNEQTEASTDLDGGRKRTLPLTGSSHAKKVCTGVEVPETSKASNEMRDDSMVLDEVESVSKAEAEKNCVTLQSKVSAYEVEEPEEAAMSLESARPLTIQEQLAEDIKSMSNVWRVFRANAHLWQFSTLRGALLLSIHLTDDTHIKEAKFRLNISDKMKSQKGPRLALEFYYSLLMSRYTEQRLSAMCDSCKSPLDLLQQLYSSIHSLNMLAQGLVPASKSYLLNFCGSSLTFSARSLKLLLHFQVTVDFNDWENINKDNVTVRVITGSINELDIAELIATISRNSEFVPRYIEVVREYVKTLEQCSNDVFKQTMM